ncbi:MAG: septation protein SpoVG family protein [Candidatus Omnitrophota bacterium]|jgi:stage V sporulation protein G
MIEVARVYKIDNISSVKAFADVVIGQVLVKGVRVVQGKNGLFAGMPKSKGKDGKWYDTVKILDDKLQQELQDTLLEAYNV